MPTVISETPPTVVGACIRGLLIIHTRLNNTVLRSCSRPSLKHAWPSMPSVCLSRQPPWFLARCTQAASSLLL